MTLPEANALFKGWDKEPPVYLSLKALLQGFVGAAKGNGAPRTTAAITSNPDVDKTLSEISVKAGRAIPVLRGKDHGLPKTVPVFDFEELKRQGRERIIARMQQRKAAANG